MPRSSRTGELVYDPEVEKAVRRRRQETKRQKEGHLFAANESAEDEVSLANNQTLRELAAPDLTHQPLCITFPALAENTAFELKSGLIQLLPFYHGLSGEEPHKHVKEFEVDAAKDWLYYLPAGSITTWAQLKKKFLEKFFPASRAASLRKEICGIKQYPGESLYEYWERFNKLCTRCPQHQISEQLLIQYFYEGLQSTDRSIIDAASGGALANKTPREAWELIEAMAENSQQFGLRESNPPRRVNEVETSSIQQQLSELTSVVRQLAMRDTPRAKVCGICTSMDHCTDTCPILQEDGAEQLWEHATKFISESSTRIPPAMATKISTLVLQFRKLPGGPSQKPGHDYYPASTEIRSLAANTAQLQQDTKADKKDQDVRISQLATAINRLESHVYGKLPSQPEVNPRNVPKYTKFLKDLCVNKRKLRGDDRVMVGKNVSAVLQRKLLPKCGDPGPLKETGIIIQLADRTCAYPDGIVEDVLVQVDGLIFPADFYVLYMDDRSAPNPSPIILGRPFLSTA
ncbi:uncharacterized protein [Coffea arabica]|uniref:Retrotransposon gag domain-containing protein n=1 Tax=Coffea arabica TaxID=13443 RepID=A0ABM4X743_COFAR